MNFNETLIPTENSETPDVHYESQNYVLKDGTYHVSDSAIPTTFQPLTVESSAIDNRKEALNFTPMNSPYVNHVKHKSNPNETTVPKIICVQGNYSQDLKYVNSNINKLKQSKNKENKSTILTKCFNNTIQNTPIVVNDNFDYSESDDCEILNVIEYDSNDSLANVNQNVSSWQQDNLEVRNNGVSNQMYLLNNTYKDFSGFPAGIHLVKAVEEKDNSSNNLEYISSVPLNSTDSPIFHIDNACSTNMSQKNVVETSTQTDGTFQIGDQPEIDLKTQYTHCVYSKLKKKLREHQYSNKILGSRTHKYLYKKLDLSTIQIKYLKLKLKMIELEAKLKRNGLGSEYSEYFVSHEQDDLL